MEDINQPTHYDGQYFPLRSITCDDIAKYMQFNLGNAFKYVWRAGRKNGNSLEKDYSKAIWYLESISDYSAYPDYKTAKALFDLIDPMNADPVKYPILSKIIDGHSYDAIELIQKVINK